MSMGRILVVDDEPDVLTLCQRVLGQVGYETRGSTNGREAISLARNHRFDVLLTDINMPDIRGLDVAQAVKEVDPEITCITMTGYGTMDLAIEALKLGIDDFIIKPFSPDELTLTVSKALEKQRLRRENARLRALIPLFELNKTLMTTIDVDDVVRQQVTDIARQDTGADHASLALIGKAPDGFESWVTSPAPLTAEQQEIDQSIARTVAEARTQIARRRSDSQNALPQLPDLGQCALVASPLLVQERLIGALIVVKQGPRRTFTQSDTELLLVLSGQAAIAIENARLFQEIQHAYDELKELDRMKSEFINIAAHELRTPLAILLGYLGIVIEEVDGDPKERLQIANRNALRLRSIIDDMLALRQLETGQSYVSIETFPVVETIRSIIEDLSPLAQEKQQEVALTGAESVSHVRGDVRKFRMILTNLLSNAIKFGRQSGRIQIHVALSTASLNVSVMDDGIGIPPDQQERIFSRFYQVEDSLTREHGGMGVGLAIAKGMVELSGGQIGVESVPGHGSKFTFTIPQN